MSEQAAKFVSEAIVWIAILAAFAVIGGYHLWDQRRRRRRRARIRAEGDWGPNRTAVNTVLVAAGRLDAVAADRLAARRRAAFLWDPRLDKIPKAARAARHRAFESERDDYSFAAAQEALARARASLGHAPQGAAVREAADCAAETAAAIVAAERLSSTEYRMLTRAWRDVLGAIELRAHSEDTAAEITT